MNSATVITPFIPLKVTEKKSGVKRTTQIKFGAEYARIQYLITESDLIILAIDGEVDMEPEEEKAVRNILLQLFDEEKAASAIVRRQTRFEELSDESRGN